MSLGSIPNFGELYRQGEISPAFVESTINQLATLTPALLLLWG